MTTMDDASRRTPRYSSVLAEPRFRVLFSSRSLAVAADALRTVALSVLIFQLTDSAFLAAVTYGISFLPQVIGGLLFGSLADRLRPRSLIVGAYLLECCSASVLALVRPPVVLSLLLVAAVACFTPVFAGASNRMVAEVLEGDAYVLGRSLSNISNSMAQILGLAFGGLAVAVLGPRNALLFGAVAYLVAAVVVRFGLPVIPASPVAGGSRSVVLDSLRSNVALLREGQVRTLLLAQWLPPAFVVGAESLVIPYAASRGGAQDAGGLLLACMPVGMIIGNFVVGRYVSPIGRRRAVFALMVLLAVPLLAMPMQLPLPLIAVLLAVCGAGFAYGLGLQKPFLDAVPEAYRGIAFGLLSTGLMTLQGVGPTVFGGLSELIPVGVCMGAAGAVTLLSAIVLHLALNRLPTAECRSES